MSVEAVNWEGLINFILLAMLIVITIGIIRVRNLFAVVMLAGIFSLLMASVFVLLDAVDVAFTEAAVGAGIATILALGTLALIDDPREKVPARFRWIPLLVSGTVGAILIWAMEGMPGMGDPNAPAQTHLGPDFISRTPTDIDVPNIVTAVLASYRGFDTLGEVAVIFTAGIGVMYLLTAMPVVGGRAQRRKKTGESEK